MLRPPHPARTRIRSYAFIAGFAGSGKGQGLQVDGQVCDSAPMTASDHIKHFSYAAPDDPRLKRLIIRAIETMTGQPYLKSLYDEHRMNPVPGESFWSAAIRNLEL